MPGGRAEAGTQWARAGGHQPGPESPGAATGAQDQWKCPSLLRPLLKRTPRAPPSEKRKGSCSQGSTVQPHSAILTGPLTRHHHVRPIHIRSQAWVYKGIRAPRLGKAYSSVPLLPGAWWLCFPRLYSRGTNFIASQRHTHTHLLYFNQFWKQGSRSVWCPCTHLQHSNSALVLLPPLRGAIGLKLYPGPATEKANRVWKDSSRPMINTSHLSSHFHFHSDFTIAQ